MWLWAFLFQINFRVPFLIFNFFFLTSGEGGISESRVCFLWATPLGFVHSKWLMFGSYVGFEVGFRCSAGFFFCCFSFFFNGDICDYVLEFNWILADFSWEKKIKGSVFNIFRFSWFQKLCYFNNMNMEFFGV